MVTPALASTPGLRTSAQNTRQPTRTFCVYVGQARHGAPRLRNKGSHASARGSRRNDPTPRPSGSRFRRRLPQTLAVVHRQVLGPACMPSFIAYACLVASPRRWMQLLDVGLRRTQIAQHLDAIGPDLRARPGGFFGASRTLMGLPMVSVVAFAVVVRPRRCRSPAVARRRALVGHRLHGVRRSDSSDAR